MIVALSLAALLLATPVVAQTSDDTADLREQIDPPLQQALARSVRGLQLDRAVNAKRLAVALVEITDPTHPRLAMLNGNEMMYAASLPKIAILLGAMQKIHDGGLSLD